MNSPIPSSDPRLTVALIEPLTAHQLEARLDEALDPVLSSRRTAQPLALKLAPLARELQDFALHWVNVIARTSGEMAYQFAALAPTALARLDGAAAETWIIQAMDTFDREGLYRGTAQLKNVDGFIASSSHEAHAVTLEDSQNVLELFVCGLTGRRLKLEAASEAYTDTETIHLPARIFERSSRDGNFLIYKALVTHLWAQARYGTFNANPAQRLAQYADPVRALALYHYLETTRIDAIIARDLPGLARELTALRNEMEAPAACALLLTTPTAPASIHFVIVRRVSIVISNTPAKSYTGKTYCARAAAAACTPAPFDGGRPRSRSVHSR